MATWTPTSKSVSVWTASSKNSSTYTAQTKSTTSILSTPGLYYGFGAFTYTGGQVLQSGIVTHWTAQTKSP